MKPPLIQKIRLENILSFGEPMELELKPLNVLIGPNGSGKSNLIESLALIRATAFDAESGRHVRSVISRGGGINEWIFKDRKSKVASLSVNLSLTNPPVDISHYIELDAKYGQTIVDNERIIIRDLEPKKTLLSPSYETSLQASERDAGQLLSTPKSYEGSPGDVVHNLQLIYGKSRIYRDWAFGRNSVLRHAQPTDLRGDSLEEDCSNLPLFLNAKYQDRVHKALLRNRLREFYGPTVDFGFSVLGGTIQIFLSEEEFNTPATRLSDGTLRYLCLLAILCDPAPPPLICIEEPELGLHPDILPGLADLLVDASTRTQLIVTTHSDIIIGALTEHSESIVVCEKEDGQTKMHRLTKEELEPWLDEYRLGQLWSKGVIGGNRW